MSGAGIKWFLRTEFTDCFRISMKTWTETTSLMLFNMFAQKSEGNTNAVFNVMYDRMFYKNNKSFSYVLLETVGDIL